MKTRTKKIILIALAGTLFLGAISGGLAAAFSHPDIREVGAYTNGDGATYYNGISTTATGTALLNELNSLNKTKRKTTIGYSGLPSAYEITDPGTSSGTIMAFYAGVSKPYTGNMNREHVWPDSLGGKSVEGDVHMPRPTLTQDNSSRGNEYYVEGKHGPSKPYKETGWDPGAFADQDETYRGDSARIIFYCAIANTNLKIVDTDGSSKPSMTMGKLSDLLKWNLRYPVQERERVRNEGAESLQGNRNPFIDHPEYACKIWGNTNSTTRSICGEQPEPTKTLTGITVNTSTTKVSYKVGDSFASAKVTATFDDGSTAPVETQCQYSGYNLNTIGTQTVTVSYTYEGVAKTTTYTITVSESGSVTHPTGLIITPSSKTIKVGQSFTIKTTVTPEDVPNKKVTFVSEDEEIATVDSNGNVLGVSPGSTYVACTTQDGNITKNCRVDVEELNEDELLRLDIIQNPYKTKYYLNEELNSYGLEVDGIYRSSEDGEDYREELDLGLLDFEYDFSTVSTKSEVKVYYSNDSSIFTTFDVQVVSGTPTTEENAVPFTFTFEEAMKEFEDAEDVSEESWTVLESDFNKLSDSVKAYFKNYTYSDKTTRAIKNSDLIENCVRSYDEVLEKHTDFNDFMGRKSAKKDQKAGNPILVITVVTIAVVAAVIVAIVVPVKARKKRLAKSGE